MTPPPPFIYQGYVLYPLSMRWLCYQMGPSIYICIYIYIYMIYMFLSHSLTRSNGATQFKRNGERKITLFWVSYITRWTIFAWDVMNSLRSRKLILFGFWLFNVYKHQISLSFFGGRESTILKNPIVMGLPRSVVEGCGSGLRLAGSSPQ